MKMKWLKPAMPMDPPYLCVFRNRFQLETAATLEFTYSADERCVLYCDGIPIARGPERARRSAGSPVRSAGSCRPANTFSRRRSTASGRR